MEKEMIVNWLRICGSGDAGHCEECPYNDIADCSGKLMSDAADLIEEK